MSIIIDPYFRRKINAVDFGDDITWAKLAQNLDIVRCAEGYAITPLVKEGSTCEGLGTSGGFNSLVNVGTETTMVFDTDRYERNSTLPANSRIHATATTSSSGVQEVDDTQAVPNDDTRINKVNYEIELIGLDSGYDDGTSQSTTQTGYFDPTSATSGGYMLNDSNMLALDGVFATRAQAAYHAQDFAITVSNFGFSLDDVGYSYEILGIRVRMKGYADDNGVRNFIVHRRKLSIGDNIDVEEKFPTSNNFLSTYGGSTDLWGESSISVAQVNSSSFGVTFCVTAENQTSASIFNCYVDNVHISVYYRKWISANPYDQNTYGSVTVSGRLASDSETYVSLVTNSSVVSAGTAEYEQGLNYFFNQTTEYDYLKVTYGQSVFGKFGHAYGSAWCADNSTPADESIIDRTIELNLNPSTKTITHTAFMFTGMPSTTVSETDWSPQDITFTTQLKYVLIDASSNETAQYSVNTKNAVSGLTGNPVKIRLENFIPSSYNFSLSNATSITGNYYDKDFLESYPRIKDMSMIYWEED